VITPNTKLALNFFTKKNLTLIVDKFTSYYKANLKGFLHILSSLKSCGHNNFWDFYGNPQIIMFSVSNFEGCKFLPIV